MLKSVCKHYLWWLMTSTTTWWWQFYWHRFHSYTEYTTDYRLLFFLTLLVVIDSTRPTTQTGPAGSEHGQAGQEQQQAARQRQVVVRRFQIAFHLDLMLILKLAAVIFVFNQDGSRLRLSALVLLASLIYL